MKRFSLIAFALLTAACTSKPFTDEVIFAVERLPITLDPRFAIDTASENAIELIFNGLTRTNNHFEVIPDLAESFEALDAKTYKFKLRSGLKFQDGSSLTSAQVVEMYKFLADPVNASPFRVVFKLLDRIETPDPLTIVVHLTEPYAFFPLAARRPILKTGSDPKKPIGSGPFQFLEMDEARGLFLAPNRNYYAGSPKLNRVRLKPVLDANVKILGLLKGSVDFAQGTSDSFPPGSLDQLKGTRAVQLSSVPSANVQYMNFNLKHPVLSNLKVRQAFAHAIDREAIVRYKLGGYGEVAHTFIPPVHWAHEKNVAHYEFDPKQAKALLDEAGFKDRDGDGPEKRFTIAYKTSTNPQMVEIAEVIKSNLEAVGIGVELKSMDFGVLFEDIKRGNFDIYTLQWTSILSPDQYYEIFHSSSRPPAGYNRNFYANPELDRLLEEGRKTVEIAKQKAIYSRVQKIVASDLPSLPLWFPAQVSAVRFRIKGYELNPRGTYSSLQSAVLKLE